MHVSALQRYAHAAFLDGLQHDEIRDLASLASWGQHPSNAERDLHRMVPSLFGPQFPEYSIGIEVYDGDVGSVVFRELRVLLPSDVLSRIWGRQSPKLWQALTGATAETTREFWANLERTSPDCASRHPVFRCLAAQLLDYHVCL